MVFYAQGFEVKANSHSRLVPLVSQTLSTQQRQPAREPYHKNCSFQETRTESEGRLNDKSFLYHLSSSQLALTFNRAIKCHWSEKFFCGFASYFMYKTWNQQRFALKKNFWCFFLMKTSSMFHFCMANECAQPRAHQPRFRVDSSSSWRHTVDTAQIRKRYNMESLEKKKRGGKYGVAGISMQQGELQEQQPYRRHFDASVPKGRRSTMKMD